LVYVERDSVGFDLDNLPEWWQGVVAILTLLGAVAGPTLIWTSGPDLSLGGKILATPISMLIGAGVGLTVGVLFPVVIAAAALVGIVYLSANAEETIPQSILTWLLVVGGAVLLLLLAMCLYLLHQRNVRWFTITWLAVGLVMIVGSSLLVARHVRTGSLYEVDSTFTLWSLAITSVLTMVSGLVYIPRAFRGTRFGERWDRLFGEKHM